MKIPIAYAEGDGIGPEIMAATLHILKEAKIPLELHKVEIGEKVYNSGQKTGIHPQTWDIIRSTKAFLKAPITTPQGGGFKSLNVTVRTTLGLFANVRPCASYAPFVATKHPNMDVVIVRENEEDLYTGIEYRQSQQTYEALKINTHMGCEKIIRYAFEYARAHNRKKVTCFTKDNILKLTDGLFHRVFDEVAKEYPDIVNEHWIVDIGAAKVAATPELFDVIVMPNLYGDIISDVAAQITGSVGLAGSANIGDFGAMFEAIHGSAPRHAGKNSANPSGLLLAAVMMLVHIGQSKGASLIHNAWLKTIEDGYHTQDIFKEGISKKLLGTKEFAQAVVDRLGKEPSVLKKVQYSAEKPMKIELKLPNNAEKKKIVGIDVYFDHKGNLKELQQRLSTIDFDGLELTLIANRGVMVWPIGQPETSCSDIWRCRFLGKNKHLTHEEIGEVLKRISKSGLDFAQIANLYTFNDKPGYVLSQLEQ
jgi:isocitrate dehydrogenase